MDLCVVTTGFFRQMVVFHLEEEGGVLIDPEGVLERGC